MILFGVRSPLVVDYEESCHRAGLLVTAAVSVDGTPRLLDRSRLVLLGDYQPAADRDGFIACAFAPGRRAALMAQASSLGLLPAAALVDPSAVLARSVRLGAGSFVNAGVVIGALSILGLGVLVNRSASLGHHTVLEDHVSIGPGVTLAGNVRVGAGAMIGAAAVVLPHVRIGAGAVVAAGALVRHHVPDGMLAVGHPARLRRFNRAGSSLELEGGE